jgi:hypothetical protein
MASLRSSPFPGLSEPGLVRPQDPLRQAEGELWLDAAAGFGAERRGLRLRTLTFLRWVCVTGQAATVLWVWLALGFVIPVLPCS